MKKTINKSLLVIFLMIGLVMISLAQHPGRPDPLGSPGTPSSIGCGSSSPSCAPIPDGYLFLLGLASIYGVSKYLRTRKMVKAI